MAFTALHALSVELIGMRAVGFVRRAVSTCFAFNWRVTCVSIPILPRLALNALRIRGSFINAIRIFAVTFSIGVAGNLRGVYAVRAVPCLVIAAAHTLGIGPVGVEAVWIVGIQAIGVRRTHNRYARQTLVAVPALSGGTMNASGIGPAGIQTVWIIGCVAVGIGVTGNRYGVQALGAVPVLIVSASYTRGVNPAPIPAVAVQAVAIRIALTVGRETNLIRGNPYLSRLTRHAGGGGETGVLAVFIGAAAVAVTETGGRETSLIRSVPYLSRLTRHAGGSGEAGVLAVFIGGAAVAVTEAGGRETNLTRGIPYLSRLTRHAGGSGETGVLAVFIGAAAIAVAETGGRDALRSIPYFGGLNTKHIRRWFRMGSCSKRVRPDNRCYRRRRCR